MRMSMRRATSLRRRLDVFAGMLFAGFLGCHTEPELAEVRSVSSALTCAATPVNNTFCPYFKEPVGFTRCSETLFETLDEIDVSLPSSSFQLLQDCSQTAV
jgi:hypothetical protein